MRFADVQTYLAAELDPSLLPCLILPGPSGDLVVQKLSPQRIIFATVGGGAGLTLEQLFDRPFITIRTVGRQGSYDDAEALAWAVDTALLQFVSNGVIGSAPITYLTRTGGAPTLLLKDSADRYHFTCSYIAETPSNL